MSKPILVSPYGLSPADAASENHPYAMTDLGNAERFAAIYGHCVRYDVSEGCWRFWDGKRWAKDRKMRAILLCKRTVRNIPKEALALPKNNTEDKLFGLLLEWARKSESRERINAMLELAKSQPGIPVDKNDLDQDQFLFNCVNGTIDLRTGGIYPHRKEDMISTLSSVEYIPGHIDPKWEAFLADATGNNPDTIGFLQIAAGYSLTGDISEEKIFMIHGPKNSGKTTYLEALKKMMGEYARTVNLDMFAKKRDGGSSPSNDIAALVGIRLAAGSEIEKGREVAEALIKNLSGGEEITARFLFKEYFSFMPQFKIWMALNHAPKVSPDDGAIWRRLFRIGFDISVPPEKKDKSLKPYLVDPQRGGKAVLAWAVAGCLKWQKEGLNIPEAVTSSTLKYREESDPLNPFFEDCLEFAEELWTSWIDIVGAYQTHCREYGTPVKYQVAPKTIQERLKDRACRVQRKHSGRGWQGVGLKPDWKTALHNPEFELGRDGVTPGDGISFKYPDKSFFTRVIENGVTDRHGVTATSKMHSAGIEVEETVI